MKKLLALHMRIKQLKSEIYILIIDDLFLDYANAENMVEDNLFIIGGKTNPETVKQINTRFYQIKQLQAALGWAAIKGSK
jgi:hypothetical protein